MRGGGTRMEREGGRGGGTRRERERGGWRRGKGVTWREAEMKEVGVGG